MAKLRAHGTELGTIYGLTSAKRYMSDGHVLKNIGFGWKLHAKVKEGIEPIAAYEKAKAKFEQLLTNRPAWATYRKGLHDTAGLSKRWKLHSTIQMMPDDPDGVWSEACDGYSDNVSADVDEIAVLCRAFKAAEMEAADIEREKAVA